MSNMKPILTPYLNFNGNTAEAMKFYQSILGGELIMQTFAEAGMAKTPEEGNRIVHADLKNETLSFMASDGPPSQQVRFGDNIHMSISGTDQNKLTEFFNKLAQGGKADMPLAKQFWGDTFGMLLPEAGPEAADAVIRKLRQSLRDESHETALPLSISGGVVTCLQPAESLEAIIGAADRLLTGAKGAGNDTVWYEVIAPQPLEGFEPARLRRPFRLPPGFDMPMPPPLRRS